MNQHPMTAMQPMPTPGVCTYPQAAPTRFRRLYARHKTFKVGCGLWVLAFIVFVVGFSAPAWKNEAGLWMDCTDECRSNVLDYLGWLTAVQAMECLALICFAVALVAEMYQDVFSMPPPADNKLVEVMSLLAGIFGIIGVAIFGAKSPNTEGYLYDSYSNYGTYPYYGTYISGTYISASRLQWAYGLTAGSSILVLICACLIAYSRVMHRAQTDTAMTAAGMPIPCQPQTVMIPMQQMPPGYGYMPPRPYPYPYPIHHPYPSHLQTASYGPQASGAQVPPTSQIPLFYVMNQGAMVAVNGETGASAPPSGNHPAPSAANNNPGNATPLANGQVDNRL